MGCYEDDAHQLHFDVPEFLACCGWPDTPTNRDTATKAMFTAFAQRFPGSAIILAAGNDPARN